MQKIAWAAVLIGFVVIWLSPSVRMQLQVFIESLLPAGTADPRTGGSDDTLNCAVYKVEATEQGTKELYDLGLRESIECQVLSDRVVLEGITINGGSCPFFEPFPQQSRMNPNFGDAFQKGWWIRFFVTCHVTEYSIALEGKKFVWRED